MSWERLARYLFAMAWGALPAMVFSLGVWPWRRRRLRRLGLASGIGRESIFVLFWMLVGAMALLTLTPRWVVSSLQDVWNGYRWNAGEYPYFSPGTINLQPFHTLYDPFIFLGNAVMFLPLGFFQAHLWRGFTWRRTLFLGGGITLFVETSQLLVGRAFDVVDLLLNALGVLAGYGVWKLWRNLAPSAACRFHCRQTAQRRD